MSDVQLPATAGQRRWWALGALALSVLVVGLDLFVLSLALPTLAVDLHASTGDLQWFVDSYSLVLAAALLPAGLLGDQVGRKRLLTGALIVFGIASAACAYSTSTGELIGARAVLGLAAAVILPLALAVIPVMFTPESRGQGRFSIDAPGVLISSAGLVSLTYGFIRASDTGWSDPAAIATMVAGVVVLAAFVAWERTVRRTSTLPLLDLDLFRSPGFTWGTTLSTMVSFALFGLTFAMPQYFLDVKGFDSLGSGIRMLPMIGGLAVGLAVGQRLQTPRRSRDGVAASPPPVSARIIGATGFAIMAVALAIG